jgi:hypothetical protein
MLRSGNRAMPFRQVLCQCSIIAFRYCLPVMGSDPITSARVIHKLLRLARTSADLDGAENIRREDITRVLGCRDLDVSSSQMYAIA